MDKGGINVWRNYCNADKIRLCGIFNFIHVYVGKLKIKKIQKFTGENCNRMLDFRAFSNYNLERCLLEWRQ